MPVVGMVLEGIAGLGSLICFILVLVQMFKSGQTALGVACIVLLFCVGIGGLIAFIYGWIKNQEWGFTTVMLVWTACIVIGIVGGFLSPPAFGPVVQPGG